ncbi:E4 ORF6/7 [bat adenovirus 10]|uniref:E4 ORF6/7 n=1 Tax=bat adenovirus 10 TaxID=3070193 RepID=A0A1X9RIW3_9ADEN|nr:E4 ORF6/7 [Bat mastadenovirus WIV18]ARQ79795.1 E4 ORF6/7 [bat adenovirus 10]
MDTCVGDSHIVAEEYEAFTVLQKDIPDKFINIANCGYLHKYLNITFKGTMIGSDIYIFVDEKPIINDNGSISVIKNSDGGRIVIRMLE